MADKKWLQFKAIVPSEEKEEISSSSFDYDSFTWVDEPNWKEMEIFMIIATEVFLKRLPEKSDIMRCRGVCKRWRSYLSTPQFIQYHRQNYPVTIDDCKLLIIDDGQLNGQVRFRTLSPSETIPPHPLIGHMNVFLRATLDGLVCVSFQTEHRENARLLLLNPYTGAHKQLSSPPRLSGGYSLFDLDPVGFYIGGSSSDDYKLVCLVANGLEGAFVYSSRSDIWKKIEFPVIFPSQCCFDWSPAIFFGQCLYFEVTCITNGLLPFCSFGFFSRIICFDVKTETFREIPVPLRQPKFYSSDAETNTSFANLVVLDGCLHMYQYYSTSDGEHGVDRWRLKDDGNDEWEKVEYTFTRQQDVVNSLCIEYIGNRLAVLDEDDNSFKEMSMQDFEAHYLRFSSQTKRHAYTRMLYVETLVDPQLKVNWLPDAKITKLNRFL